MKLSQQLSIPRYHLLVRITVMQKKYKTMLLFPNYSTQLTTKNKNPCCLVLGGLVLKLQAEASSSVASYHHWSCPRSKSLLYVAQRHSFA